MLTRGITLSLFFPLVPGWQVSYWRRLRDVILDRPFLRLSGSAMGRPAFFLEPRPPRGTRPISMATGDIIIPDHPATFRMFLSNSFFFWGF